MKTSKGVLPKPTAASYIALAFLLCYNFVYAQQLHDSIIAATLPYQIEIRHDNDLLMGTDYYYTAGLFFTFRKAFPNGLFSNGNEQLSFTLTQEMHTPFEIETSDFNKMDRPYAGFLGVQGAWSYAKANHALELGVLLGVTGSISGAGSLQKWYHRTIISSDEPTWVGQIANSFHTNMYAAYVYEWQWAPNPFSIYFGFHPQIALGTKDIYAQPELLLHFGKRNPISSSMAFKRVGTSELFVSIKAGYRFVGYNALLEGHLFGDSSEFTVAPEKVVFHGGIDFQWQKRNTGYFVGYRYNAAEASQTIRHQFMVFSISRRF
ncbi:lipid A deacylase LpxR family protein [Arenibacter sp. GZD96]|uniref:lipid A deacylase LpxR family protein n=1 Tax=Aurantibrevibacter litoralis TaxID=3106030 RepID=UPI002AFEAC57|nr:lipid A deacylase LpxR family protein [Arenibacter sp. GZD-96]MEA1785739.1 lipid A deacylase LpxR family protein [Arenibacter sp. GZD-96]